VKKRLKDY
jgi:hypothetical protein